MSYKFSCVGRCHRSCLWNRFGDKSVVWLISSEHLKMIFLLCSQRALQSTDISTADVAFVRTGVVPCQILLERKLAFFWVNGKWPFMGPGKLKTVECFFAITSFREQKFAPQHNHGYKFRFFSTEMWRNWMNWSPFYLGTTRSNYLSADIYLLEEIRESLQKRYFWNKCAQCKTRGAYQEQPCGGWQGMCGCVFTFTWLFWLVHSRSLDLWTLRECRMCSALLVGWWANWARAKTASLNAQTVRI